MWRQWKSKNVIFGPHIQLGMSSSLNETNVMCYSSGVMVFEMVLGINCKIMMPLTSYSWVILSLFKKHLGLLQIIPCWICTLFPIPCFSHWILTIQKERKPSKSWWDERWGVHLEVPMVCPSLYIFLSSLLHPFCCPSLDNNQMTPKWLWNIT